VEERGQRIAAELRLGVAEILVAAASSGRAPRRQINDGGGGAPTGGAGQGGGGTQARKQRGAVLWARGTGDRAVPGSDAERQRGAGGMPLDSGESKSDTRWAAAPDGPARQARGWAGAGLGRAGTGAGPSWAVCLAGPYEAGVAERERVNNLGGSIRLPRLLRTAS
jgi:hypothetical protein